MKYQEWLNGCGCCPDIQDCPPSTGNPCDCDSILLELSKQHTDDLVLQDEIDNLDEKKLDASAYTPDEYATEEWVNEQGFLKTVEPLKTINGESLIGEGDIVISGGSGDAYTKAETDALLDEKQNVLNAGDYVTIDSANTISTSGLVTVVDNEVPDYNVTNEITYQGGYPSQTETASTWDDASMFTLRYNFIKMSDVNRTTTAAVIDPSGNITTGSVATDEYRIGNPLPDYIDMVEEDVEFVGAKYYFTAKEGYRIAHLDVYSQGPWSSSYGNIIEERVDTVFEGGQSADVIKDVIEPELINKQDTLIAGDYITIDSANTVSTSGLVTVEDNEVEEYLVLTSDIYDPSNADFNVASYDDAADVFEYITPGQTYEYFDVSNSYFVFINESGETTADINGIYMFSTSGAVYPTRIQEYVNLDLYEYHTTDKYNVHLKYSCKNGWRLKHFSLGLRSGYSAGVEFKTYQNYPALQSADAISENVYPALEKLTANKFDKNFTCNDPLLYEAAYKRFSIKTSHQNYDAISASTSATTNLARAYDVKTYVESKIASGITSGEVQTMIDNSISGKADADDVYKKTETSSKTEIDDALLLDAYEDYKTKNTYTGAFPSLTGTADWNIAIQGGIYAKHSDDWRDSSYEMSFKLQVVDENGNTFSAATSNITEISFTVDDVNPLPDYLDVIRPTYEESPYYDRVLVSWIFKPKDGYRISYAEINSYWEDEFRKHNDITEIEWYDAFPSGYTKDIIENYIEPKLANAQEKLSFESNVKLSTYGGKLVPYVPTDYNISDWYSASTNPVQTQAVYKYAYSKAEADAKLADKQNKLTAGTGIDITNNVISVTGGGASYSAGTGIDITNNVISSTLNAYNGTGVGSLIIGQSANTASGDYSVAVGAQTEALGGRSFAQGLSGKTTNTAEITFGQLNDTKNAYAGFGHSGNTLFTVGNGAGIDGSTTDYARHNAFEVRSNGDIYIPEPSKVNPSHYYQAPMIKLQDRLNEIDNKPNIWCGSESQWSQISGSTESGTLYLIY